MNYFGQSVLGLAVVVLSVACSTAKEPESRGSMEKPQATSAPLTTAQSCNPIDLTYGYDQSDWNVLSGKAAAIAVVSVTRVVGESHDMSPGHVPETTFAVRVDKSVKGELQDAVDVVQSGTANCQILDAPLVQVGRTYVAALSHGTAPEYGLMGSKEISAADAQSLKDGKAVSPEIQAVLDAIANPVAPAPGQ